MTGRRSRELVTGGGIAVAEILLLELEVRLVNVACDLNGQFILALEVVVDVADRAAGRLRDLLDGDILEALAVEQIQRGILDFAAHLKRLPFSGCKFFAHSSPSVTSG